MSWSTRTPVRQEADISASKAWSRRQPLRLKAYDYAQPGAYFVTVCTEGRARLFGSIDDGQLAVNDFGRLVAECWSDLPRHYQYVTLDAFVVMPNHVHGVIVLRGYDEGVVGAINHANDDEPGWAGLRPAPTAKDHADDANDADDVGAGLREAPLRGRPAPTAKDQANADDAVGAGLRPARSATGNSNDADPGWAGLREAPLRGRPAPTANNHANDDDDVGAGLRPARPATGNTNDAEPGWAGLRPAPTAKDQANADDVVGAGLRPARPATGNANDAEPGWAGLREAPLRGRPAPTAGNDAVPKRHALPEIVRAFKSFSARRINDFRNAPGAPVWQRNYFEHVVRSESDLDRIRIYIRDNPARWTFDKYFAAGEMGR